MSGDRRRCQDQGSGLGACCHVSGYFPLTPTCSELPRHHPLRNTKLLTVSTVPPTWPWELDLATQKIERLTLTVVGCVQVRYRNLVTLVCV